MTLAALVVFAVLHVLTNDARTNISGDAAASAPVSVSTAVALTAASTTDADETSSCRTSSWSVCNLFNGPQVPSLLLTAGVSVFALTWLTQPTHPSRSSDRRDRACLSRITLCISRI